MTYSFMDGSNVRRFKTLDAARKAAARLRRPVIQIYGSNGREVGAYFDDYYYFHTHFLHVTGIWRSNSTGSYRYVRVDGTLGSYADDFVREELKPYKVYNAATGKLETRRY